MANLDTLKSFLGKGFLNIPKHYLRARGDGLVDIAAPRCLPLSAPTFSSCRRDAKKSFAEEKRRGYLTGIFGGYLGIFIKSLQTSPSKQLEFSRKEVVLYG